MIVSGDDALRGFRESLTGHHILSLLADANGGLRVDLAVGVGKSRLVDRVVETAVQDGIFSLVIVLTATRKILAERAWIKDPPADVKIINLRPRPSSDCGIEQNARWVPLEKNGMGLFGRTTICAECKKSKGCFWPGQYAKKSLDKAEVIYATQTHLLRAGDFLDQVQNLVGANRTLVLIDEGSFAVSPFRRTLGKEQLTLFLAALEAAERQQHSQAIIRMIRYTEVLISAITIDLRQPDWATKPLPVTDAARVQAAGWGLFGKEFHYLSQELSDFGRSPMESRARLTNGAVRFAVLPRINQHFIFFSGSANDELITQRVGIRFDSPFTGITFRNPGTIIYNISSAIGMAKYFSKNAPQIFDFFAELLARRLCEGKRVALLTKKRFVETCVKQMQQRLDGMCLSQHRVVSAAQANTGDPFQVPVLHYGLIGTNDFEHYDCLYALCGYYINETVMDSMLHDILADDYYVPVAIQMIGRPLRRQAGVKHAQDKVYDTDRLAQMALAEQEGGVVLQAAGRVRPFTRPRELILMQCGTVPGFDYDEEFLSLAAARHHFGIATRRQQQTNDTAAAVARLRQDGLTQKQVAAALQVSLRTVKRRWA